VLNGLCDCRQPSSPVSAPVSKVAELKKLKTGRQERHVLGAELSSLGVSSLCIVYWHCPHSMWSRVYVTLQCLSVPFSRCSTMREVAAVGPVSRRY